MLNFQFLFSLSLYIFSIYAGFIQDKLFEDIELHIDRFNGPCRNKNVPCQGYFHGIKIRSTKLFIRNYTVVIKEGGFTKLMLSMTIDRCISKENLDTCEEYFKPPNIDLCKVLDTYVMSSKNPLAFPLVPPVKCPVNKGIHHAYNFTFDLAPLLVFKVEGWYWKVKTEVFAPEQNKIIYCSLSEGHFTNSKFKRN